MNACTIIARNYLAHARVLAHSFREHHPQGRFTVLVIDGEQPFAKEPNDEFDVMVPWEIGLDETELHRMAAIYDVMELATAAKPFLLKALLARDNGAVTYFDPDIEIFRPLDDIDRLARERSIVLTPHTLDPLPHNDDEPGEVTLLRAGMFNLGFIAVGETAGPFLDWWAERLARSGHVDPKRALFVDQRWVDFVPSLFDHTVLRDPGCNVAHWNLETRRFELVDGEYRVDDQPLRFFHFSGFDPAKPHLLSKFLGPRPSILLSEHPDLARICGEYASKLEAAGHLEAKREPYGFERMANGVLMTRPMRRLYTRELAKAESEGGELPPDPFDEAGAERFLAWLNELSHPGAHGLTRYLAALHADRGELRQQFPEPRWTDRVRYLEWVAAASDHDPDVPRVLVPDQRPETPPVEPQPGGVNIAGYFRAEAGVGQAARHVIAALRRAGIPFTTVSFGDTPSRQAHAFEDAGETAYDINVICVNADQLNRFGHHVGLEFFRNRHSIGIWWWEVSRFPAQFHSAFDLLNEVWVGSEFVREAIAAETEKPVFRLPIGIELPGRVDPLPRQRVGIPEGFMFLFSFDFDSRFERKNPLAIVDAFRRAFEPGEGPVLLLKSINGDRNLRDLEQLRACAGGRDDIVVFDGYLSSEESESLMAACDCYVSLHRSEGFGLTMAEAMAHGKPVIATGYSGNVDFMTEDTSRLVPYRLVEIPTGVDPYPPGGEWADPDVDAAVAYMRELYEDPDRARELGRRAREHVSEVLSPDRTAAFLESRLKTIWEARASIRGPASGTDRARRYLREGPSATIRGPSRLGPIGRLYRRAVYRLLRPYTARHAEFEHAVADGLQELKTQLATIEAEVRRLANSGRARPASEEPLERGNGAPVRDTSVRHEE
jgi:glycosyltransferase involved in cell wall biosynthesis